MGCAIDEPLDRRRVLELRQLHRRPRRRPRLATAFRHADATHSNSEPALGSLPLSFVFCLPIVFGLWSFTELALARPIIALDNLQRVIWSN